MAMLPWMLAAALMFGRPALAQHAAPTRFARIPVAVALPDETAPDTAVAPPVKRGPRVALGAVTGAVFGSAVLWGIAAALHKSACANNPTCKPTSQDRGPRDSAIAGALIGAAIGALVASSSAPES
jgi:hypothetical protein